jgi:predicted AlkP superfamily phosphohydrolase/phosphomutase
MKNNPRTVMVGLDGVPHSLLSDLQKEGYVPNMSTIFQKGHLGRMDVCIPEISSVSWTSFMTGKQSGEHGIYGFMDIEPGTYSLFFPNYAHLQSETLWDELGSQGLKSVVINMPATYPAHPIHGAIISGFVALDIDHAVYPVSLADMLHSIGYRVDIDTSKARSDQDFLFRDLSATLNVRNLAVDKLWNEIDWDLFIVVITGTDRLMHFLWDAYENRSHPYHENFLEYFQKVDQFVGNMYERFASLDGYHSDRNTFFMISDHGFTGIKSEVYLNAWLEDNGFLKFNNDNPRMISEIGPGSKAFALDPSRIYINRKGKYPLGCVDRFEYEHIRQDLVDGLQSLKFGVGDSVMKKVYTKEELYFGKCIDTAPDLVALSNHGFDLKGKVSAKAVFGRSALSGMHTQDDAFFFSSNGKACQNIFEAKKILLDSLLKTKDMVKEKN